jgi:hypothetical protein
MLEMVPVRTYFAVALLGLGGGLVAASIATGVVMPRVAAAPTIEVAATPIEPDPIGATPQHDVMADASVQLVFSLAGESYVALQELDAKTLPRHGKLRMIAATPEADYVDAAIAPVAAKDAPEWRGHTIVVDAASGPCTAALSDFAIVARLDGDPGYAGIDKGSWTVQSILDNGHIVLAAKLAGCTGTLARDAAAQPVVRFKDVIDTANATVARRLVLESQAAAEITAEWKAASQTGNPFDSTELVTKVVADPRTGAKWISVHANGGFSCGDPNVNIWGLFRVEANGNLTTIALRRPENLSSVDELADLDGDGIPEIVGQAWLGPNTVVTDVEGTELARLDVPFFGCPC